MKRLLVITLLLVYTISQLSVLAWYYGKQLIHALSADWQFIKTTWDDDHQDLTQAKLDTSAYQAQVKDEEISLNGILYDITKTSLRGKTIYLTLQKDEVETYLLSRYHQFTNWISRHHPSKQSEQYVLNWMMKLYFSARCNFLSDHFTEISCGLPVPQNKYLPSPFSDIPPKPPEQSVLSV